MVSQYVHLKQVREISVEMVYIFRKLLFLPGMLFWQLKKIFFIKMNTILLNFPVKSVTENTI